MNRLALFFSIIIAITATTWALKAQTKPKEKSYNVALTYNEWVRFTQQLEFIKGQLRQSDLPSKNVAYISDSLINYMQVIIGQQVSQQLDAQRAAQQKRDTTKSKK